MLDLEKVAERTAIDRSYDLRTAFGTKRLRLCSQGVVSNTAKPEVQVVEKIVEKHHHYRTEEHHHEKEALLDEARILAMMRAVIKEHQPQQTVVESDNKQVLDAVAVLQQQIQAMGGEESGDHMPSIDPVKLAELTSKAVDKVSEGIETGNIKPGRRVILKNTRLGDLADELD